MKSHIKSIALVILTVLVVTTVWIISSAKASHYDRDSRTAGNAQHVQDGSTTEPVIESMLRALAPASTRFRPKLIWIASVPNFARPTRRAPLRRKGRIQG